MSKRILYQILLFLFSMCLLCWTYIKLFQMSALAVAVILLILLSYAACMGAGEKSIRQLKKYERKLIGGDLADGDNKKILLFSLSSLTPAYFCIILMSFVPLFTYEVWFITVFPCIILCILPAQSVLEEYRGLTRRKAPFLTAFAAIVAICCSIGMLMTSFLL